MKIQDPAQELLNSAAVETMDRIRVDQDQVPARLKPMLSYIESHLFDPELTVNRLKKACGIRDNSVAIHFHAAVGKPPHAYISQCRLETAARLLRDSDLPVWKISDLLGFSSIQVFSRAFHRWSGQRPTTFRRDARRAHGQRPLPARGNGEGRTNGEYWNRALNGDLPDDEAASLIQLLLQIYPPGRRSMATLSSAAS
ncbi:MAG: helix-turn-helix transcriptional regulator [Acidobacteriota bacterium]